jgi:hypothetical protein
MKWQLISLDVMVDDHAYDLSKAEAGGFLETRLSNIVRPCL